MKTMTDLGYKPTTLDELYKSLPQRVRPPKVLFVERMAEACKCSTQTIRMWIQGVQKPLPLVQEVLIDALLQYGYITSKEDIDLATFFPSTQKS